MEKESYRIIMSGGGTGGHIFPAISIADELRNRYPSSQILFVGAEGRMEMTRVPQCGYQIEGLPIAGIQRSLSPSNLLLPFKLIRSLYMAYKIIRRVRPHIVIGTGGYASAPVLFAASMMGVPTLIQEQNGFAGLTNKILARRAKKICVAYDGLEKVFPASKIVYTGNPIRSSITQTLPPSSEAINKFGLKDDRKTIVVLGGSLGAREINKAIFSIIPHIIERGYQIIWQCGRLYYEQYKEALEGLHTSHPSIGYDKYVRLYAFVEDMNALYAASDLIISRAGASTVSELCVIARPCILIPSPNVAENHQWHNAMALVRVSAARIEEECENLSSRIMNDIDEILSSDDIRQNMSAALKTLARPEATSRIADEVEIILGTTHR